MLGLTIIKSVLGTIIRWEPVQEVHIGKLHLVIQSPICGSYVYPRGRVDKTR